MKAIRSFVLFLMLTTSLCAQKSAPFAIGETVSFSSEILDEERTLNIYLPQGYELNSEKRYPVIYLLDGSADEDFIHIAGLVQFASFSWINMIPESIVVGIANTDRKKDFTFPTQNIKDKRDFPTTGGSENFIRFLESELQPFIEKSYQVTAEKTLIGQSLGGLLATEILFFKPHLFDHYIIVSPSLWWNDESLLEVNPKAYNSPKTVYIGVGKEGPIMERVANELYSKLNDNVQPNTELKFYFFEELNHGDTLHLAVYDAFKKIFAPKNQQENGNH